MWTSDLSLMLLLSFLHCSYINPGFARSFQALKQYKNEALKMLEVIKVGYSTFQDTIIHESKKLPSLLQPDLKFYNKALCQHLQVSKQETHVKPSQSVGNGVFIS